ncbi:ABC transporter substrate-binding protein [Phytoactinopolyspora halotolerans]|uniref:Extracellular solute-binding protein n=1 Tax=Phytoactinopolyspora halotolerans TaxID=1981512 RepID=A0A6L9SDT4_9ACTN|nr:extracellular solute-binding protein [Phytoactinopolyspora halotolerans]NEE03189.1 extracellular solute-binding protein [Phytoactinopolyspora halotolerans]
MATTRSITAAGLAAAVTAILAACTPGSDSAGADDTGSAESPDTVSTEVPDEEVTLKLAFVDGPEMVDELIAAFEEEYPQVTIDPQFTEFTDYVASIRLNMTSDTAPDIAQFNVGAMSDLIASGHLLDLDPYSEAYSWPEKFPPVGLEQLTADDSGKVYGTGSLRAVPAGMSLTGVFYNKELAAEAGIEVPPATLDEFEQALETAKEAGQTPISIGALDSGGAHMWAALLNSMMPVDDYRAWVGGEPGGSITGDDALAATEKFTAWAEQGYFNESANGTDQEASTAQFVDGQSVFLMNGNWAAAQVANEMGEDAGFFLLPGLEPDSPAVGSGFSVSYAISAQTEHPEAAAAFLDFLASEQAAEIESQGGFLPPNVDAAPAADGVLGDLNTEFARVVEADGLNVFPDFSAPATYDAMSSGVQELIAGRTEPAAFLEELQGIRDEHHAE